jgi:glycosyltransferase involved in cell wall biosynthesis
MRLAFFSPFNPLKTGVADYSEELLPFLSEHCEIDLVVDGYTLSNADIRERYRILTPSQFLRCADRYDMTVYQLANSVDQHGYMIPCMKRSPGIAVLHDYYLHYLMLGLTLMKGDMPALKRIFAAKYGGSGSALAHRVLLGLYDPYKVSTTVPLVNMSRGVIMHSRYGESLVSEDAGGKPVRVIPMGIPIRPLLDSASLKRKYGYDDDDFVLASVSTLSHTKRTHAILPALKRLWQRYPQLKFLILGGGKLSTEARRQIEALNLTGQIRLTGWLAPEDYWECLNLADAAIDLRYPSGAETSASLLRAMSAGKALIVSKQGSFIELPDDCSLKVPVDGSEEQSLVEAVSRLLDNVALTREMGAASRRHSETTHRLDLAAKSYMDLVRHVNAANCAEPVVDWFEARPGQLTGAVYGSVFKASRMVSLLRNYGARETIRRLRSASKPSAQAAPGGAARAGGAA